MSAILVFKSIENKHNVQRGKDCIKRFCDSLREHDETMKKKQQKIYENVKICYICNKKIENKSFKDQKYRKVRVHYQLCRNISSSCT